MYDVLSFITLVIPLSPLKQVDARKLSRTVS